jgi:hypothetical protein
MKRPLDKDVAAFLNELKDFGADLKYTAGAAAGTANKVKGLKSAALPASGAELDEDLPDLSPGVKDK